MRQRKQIGAIFIILLAFGIGYLIKNVKVGLVIGLMIGLFAGNLLRR